MKSGMHRKIDELGRIVIPIEIRKTLKLNMGDSLEIYVEDNKIMLKRHSSLIGLEEDLFNIAKVINELTNATIIFSDINNLIVCYGRSSENYIDKKINKGIFSLFKTDELLKINSFYIVNDYFEKKDFFIFPLYGKNTLEGLMIVIENENDINSSHLQIIDQFKKFIVKQLDS